MKITYLKLENVAGIYVGLNKTVLEINFDKSINSIVAIIGNNGNGKSVLLSSLSPFSGVTSVDERSSLSYIIPGKNGYKEIHYRDNFDEYVIKHYYKASKDTHTIKSYFMKNGEELNENGNVTSFNSLVEIHLGLTQEMMRLIRIGTNVNSFITLSPARRKEYIGKLIEEIDLYLKIHKDVNDELRVVRTLINSNNSNLYNCHISDVMVEEEKLHNLAQEIKAQEKERDNLIRRISRIQALMTDNNVEELRRKRQEAEASLIDFQNTERIIHENSLENVTIHQLLKIRADLSDKKVDVQSRINSYRMAIDSASKAIERLEVSIKKVTSNNDLQSLLDRIQSLKGAIQSTPKMITEFMPSNITSDDVSQIIMKLSSFNQISKMIQTFGSKPVDVYLGLKRKGKSVDAFLKEQRKKIINGMTNSDLNILFDRLFQDDGIITPNCSSEYAECPYYRLSEVINEMKDSLEEENLDSETLRYIQVISNNIDNILNELDHMMNLSIPDNLKDDLREKRLYQRLEEKLPFFDISPFQEYLSILKDFELYTENVEKLKQYEYQLSIYRQSGIDHQMKEIQRYRDDIKSLGENIDILTREIQLINQQLEKCERHIGLVTKYNDDKKYHKIVESTLESTNKILEPLESASQEKQELDFQLRRVTEEINRLRNSHKMLESKIEEYNRLVKEGEELSRKYKDLSMILESVSTKKGIPVIYMKQYLGKIQQLANRLLQLIYDDALQIGKFKVTQDTFEVPYIKNGTKISDVKYASQSEIALITMALSFALANRATGKYNILLLDEIDAGLDEVNRSAFLKMLNMQMRALQAEQVFIISHNLTQMVNVPMDCIKLSDIGMKSKLQNVIYE